MSRNGIDPWENLANTIILQAVKDYRRVLKAPEKPANMKSIRECEQFFRSAWYRSLTTVDGEMIIAKLREEAENGREQDDRKTVSRSGIPA